jgi:hypothetical protein
MLFVRANKVLRVVWSEVKMLSQHRGHKDAWPEQEQVVFVKKRPLPLSSQSGHFLELGMPVDSYSSLPFPVNHLAQPAEATNICMLVKANWKDK